MNLKFDYLVLTTILTVPFEKEKDLEFTIIRYKDSIYMSEILTQHNRFKKLNCDEKTLLCEYWGYKRKNQ